MRQLWAQLQVLIIWIHPLNSSNGESYYDIFDDWGLIEASFLKQYGLRIRTNPKDDDMSWPEFCNLLAGLMPDTPLGQVVVIRAEKDAKVIKDFSPEQRRIRNEYITKRNKKLKEDPAKYKAWVDSFQSWAKSTFS